MDMTPGENEMIRAIIFDLDDTLYGYEALDREARVRVRELACGELGIPAEAYEEAYSHGRSETKRQLGDVAALHNRLLSEDAGISGGESGAHVAADV